MTTTIFLPQSRMSARKARSLSVNGRSADVTNSTRSACGTNSLVNRSCSRKIALVPGVSTILRSLEERTGAVMMSAPDGSARRPRSSPNCRIWSLRRRRRDALFEDARADEGIDEGALAGVELADDHEEKQPIELRDRPLERRAVVGGDVEAGERELQPARATHARPRGVVGCGPSAGANI